MSLPLFADHRAQSTGKYCRLTVTTAAACIFAFATQLSDINGSTFKLHCALRRRALLEIVRTRLYNAHTHTLITNEKKGT